MAPSASGAAGCHLATGRIVVNIAGMERLGQIKADGGGHTGLAARLAGTHFPNFPQQVWKLWEGVLGLQGVVTVVRGWEVAASAASNADTMEATALGRDAAGLEACAWGGMAVAAVHVRLALLPAAAGCLSSCSYKTRSGWHLCRVE